jgi:hypothetical protein
MTLKEKVFAEVAQNPERYANGNFQELADKVDSTKQVVKNYVSAYRKIHGIPASDPRASKGNPKESSADTTFKQQGDNAEYAFKTDRRIQTLQDLIDACDIDLSVWEIDRWVCNKWEVGAKNAAKEVQVHPLFQVKVWLRAKKGKSFFELKDELIAEMKRFAPRYPVIRRKALSEKHLFVVDPGDPHFGKYASEWETSEGYNLKKAEERYTEGIERLIDKVAYYKIDKIAFIGGNDKFHVDSPHNHTTSGTRQDTDGMWFEHFRSAKRCEIAAIDRLLTVADVHYVHCPSNHDYQTGFYFADNIASWYHRNKNISFDISPAHRKYMQYGTSLIGMTHGDGAKEEILPDLMAKEARAAWAQTRYGYWYLHHIHHKDKKARKGKEKIQLEKDKIGVSILHTNLGMDPEDYCHIEYLRSISGTDSWHHRNGYCGSFRAMEAFIHHPIAGQINRLIHLF